MFIIIEAAIILGLITATLSVISALVRGYNARKMKKLEHAEKVTQLVMQSLRATDPEKVRIALQVAGSQMSKSDYRALEEKAIDLELVQHDQIRRYNGD